MRSLTPRQKEIAGLAMLGLTNAEIATALTVTPADVLAELEALHRAQRDVAPSGSRLPSDPGRRPARLEGGKT